MKIKKNDLAIITNLRTNARETLTNMSRRTRIPVSTIFDRIKVQEDSLIKKHTTLLNFEKLGFISRAFVIFGVEKENREGLKEFLLACPNINSVLKINNGFNFMVEFVFRNMVDVENCVEDIEERFDVKHKKVHYIIEDLKREGFLEGSDKIDLLFPKAY